MPGTNNEFDSGQPRFLRSSIVNIAAALVVPAAYVFGRAYREAWIVAHGLPYSAFNVSFEDALLESYIGLIQGATRAVSFLFPSDWFLVSYWVLAFCVLFVAAVAWIFASAFILGLLAAARQTLCAQWRKLRQKRGAESTSKIWKGSSRALLFAYMAASLPVLFAGIAVYLLFLFALPAFIGSKIGKIAGAEAAQQIRDVQAGYERGGDSNFVYLAGMGGRVYGRLIVCGEIGCGVQTNQGAEFVVWDKIQSISSRPHSELSAE